MKRYDSQVAIVTGASSGIGRRLALDLVERGATVVGIARRKDLLDELREQLSTPSSDTVACDVADAEQFRGVLRDVETRCGQIDILINNAAIEQPTPVASGTVDVDTYRRIMDVNFFGA